jgi:hypothetical protein
MTYNPESKSFTIRLDALDTIYEELNCIESLVLETPELKGLKARGICSCLNYVRDCLSIPRGTQRHEMFIDGE